MTIRVLIVMTIFPTMVSASNGSEDIRSATTSLLNTAQYVIGALVFINLIFTVWALVTGSSKAKNFVLGTVVGIVVWFFVHAVVRAGNVGF